jgi:hypothetical protein
MKSSSSREFHYGGRLQFFQLLASTVKASLKMAIENQRSGCGQAQRTLFGKEPVGKTLRMFNENCRPVFVKMFRAPLVISLQMDGSVLVAGCGQIYNLLRSCCRN